MRRKYRSQGRRPISLGSKDQVEIRQLQLRQELAALKLELDQEVTRMRAVASERDHLRALLADVMAQGTRFSVFGIELGPTLRTRRQAAAIKHALSHLGNVLRSSRVEDLRLRLSRMSADVVQGELELERLERRADATESRLRRDEHKLRRERARQDRRDADASLAAQVRGNVRMASAVLRRRLRRDHPCPYCSGPLEPTPHADHIHPVSKGGLPTLANYVFVCPPCNQAKSDLTLTQFMDKMNFDRDQVLRALRDLGKDV